ncbi:MAG: hypothetical protein MJ154_03770 [Candidatus Saccharibacteria bacterium]|nr:hypothetical protein [Candidatus Saccharibacteria bacterium]
MDNKAYLDQIAVKGKVKSGPIFTPMLIKLIAAGVILLITLVIVGNVISSSNAKITQTYERVYYRVSQLSTNSNTTNPLKKYLDKLRDSNLRSYATNLFSVLTSANQSLGGVISGVGVKTSSISKEVTTAESGSLTAYMAALDNAVLAGTLDRTFATETNYQVSTLIQYSNESLKKTNNQAYANTINKFIQDLTVIQQQIEEWSNSH